jgi:hypothetical protein
MDAMAEVVAKAEAQSFKDTSRLAEIIRDYNPALELRYVPKKDRTDPNEVATPFCIVHKPLVGEPQLVMFLSEREVANPTGVLSRLFNSDNTKHAPGAILARVAASERAKEIWDAKIAQEEQEEKLDFWRSVWNSKKHTYRHNGRKLSI